MPGADAYNGVYRAQVVAPPAGYTGVWVTVARLNGDEPMGPCEHIGAAVGYPSGAGVFVATIGGIKDDLVILGLAG